MPKKGMDGVCKAAEDGEPIGHARRLAAPHTGKEGGKCELS